MPQRALAGCAALWGALCLMVLEAFLWRGARWGLRLGLPPLDVLSAAMALRAAGLLVTLLWFWLGAWGLGRLLLKRAGLGRAEGVLFSLALGSGAISLLTLALGMAGLLSRPLLSALFYAAGAAGLVGLRRVEAWTWPAFDRESAFAAGVAVLFAGAALLYALLPVTFYDALVYHLALPDLFLRRGAIVAVPTNVYSGLPAGLQMLFLYLGCDEAVCQLLHWSFALLTAAAVWLSARRMGARGAWAAAILLSTPLVITQSWKPAAELVWSFYAAAALLALLQEPESRSERLCGILVGLALSVKYQAVFLPAAAAAFLISSRGWRQGLRASAVMVALASLVYLPWLLKNLWLTGNPVYPFFEPSFAIRALLGSSEPRQLASLSGLAAYFAHPWAFFFSNAGWTKDCFSILLAAVLPFAPFTQPSRELKAAFWFSVVFYLPMSLASGIGRYQVPALAPLCVVAAAALPAVFPWLPARLAGAGLVFLMSGLIAFDGSDPEAWPALRFPAQAGAYLSRPHANYPAPPFAVFDWANAHLPQSAKVLLIDEDKSFYLQRDREAGSFFAPQPLELYVGRSASAEDLLRLLRAAGITHLYWNYMDVNGFDPRRRLPPAGARILKDFMAAHAKLLFQDRSPTVFRTRDATLYEIR